MISDYQLATHIDPICLACKKDLHRRNKKNNENLHTYYFNKNYVTNDIIQNICLGLCAYTNKPGS